MVESENAEKKGMKNIEALIQGILHKHRRSTVLLTVGKGMINTRMWWYSRWSELEGGVAREGTGLTFVAVLPGVAIWTGAHVVPHAHTAILTGGNAHR